MECQEQDLQVLVVLQGLVHPQAGGLLAQVMALDTTTEQAVLGLATEVLDIQVVDLATMDLSVVNIQALAVRAILQVDNMVDILEVSLSLLFQKEIMNYPRSRWLPTAWSRRSSSRLSTLKLSSWWPTWGSPTWT